MGNSRDSVGKGVDLKNSRLDPEENDGKAFFTHHVRLPYNSFQFSEVWTTSFQNQGLPSAPWERHLFSMPSILMKENTITCFNTVCKMYKPHRSKLDLPVIYVVYNLFLAYLKSQNAANNNNFQRVSLLLLWPLSQHNWQAS